MTEMNPSEHIPTDQEPGKNKDDEATRTFFALARKRLKRATEADAENRTNSLDDIKFLIGDQWPDKIARQRKADSRPVLTTNKLGQFVNQIVNETRINRPQIKVSPVDDKGDPKTAEVIQGLIRHIEYGSQAHRAYTNAAQHAADGGYGFIRIRTEYANNDNFDQEILIERVRNRYTVYMDPDHQQPDASDAKWFFIIDPTMDKDEFREQYPNADLTSVGALAEAERGAWITADKITVAEYYTVTETPKVVKLKDGDGAEQERTLTERTVNWYKMTGTEVLEKREWPSIFLPIVQVVGVEIDVEGKPYRHGLIRFGKDPMRTYNFYNTSLVEDVALRPKAPYVMAEGQQEGHEAAWKDANVKTSPYLLYKPVALVDKLAPPPRREPPAEVPQGNIAVLNQATEDLHQTTGVYPNSLGRQADVVQSGRAKKAEIREGDVGSFHYQDNLADSMGQVGRILVDMIPRIYDTERAQRIIGEDDSYSMAQLGKVPVEKGGEPKAYGEIHEKGEDGQPAIKKIYDLSVGRYDVRVSTGPSYTTKREEAAEMMLQFSKVLGPDARIIMDLIAKNQDWPGADEIAKRLKTLLPPELLKEEGDDERDTEEELAQANAQLEQMGPQIEQMQQVIQQLSEALNEKRSDQDIEVLKAQLTHHWQSQETQGNIQVAVINALKELDLEHLRVGAAAGQGEETPKEGAAEQPNE